MASEPFLITVLADVIRSLNEQGADYALAGGLAYGALVEARATTDLDLLILLENPAPESRIRVARRYCDAAREHRDPRLKRGAVDPAVWGPWGDGHRIFYKGLDCRACFHPDCFRGEPNCMRQISLDEVWEAVRGKLPK